MSVTGRGLGGRCHGVRPAGSDPGANPKGRAEEAGDDVHEAGGGAVGLHAGDGLIREVVASAAQARSDDADRVAGGEAPGLEALGKGQHVLVAEGVLQLGESAQRETQRKGTAAEVGLDLAAVRVGH
jgi:hypothetical protein